MVKEAIILAGGLGTRLRASVPDLPKCMAPVAGRPFLSHVISYLRSEGIEKFIFSLGYKHELIEAWLSMEYATLNFQTVIEEEPLGTGGAIRLACRQAGEAQVLVANGDTLFRIPLDDLALLHQRKNATCSLALKSMKNFDRYGLVELDPDQSVSSFKEKNAYKEGNINGGLYVLDVNKFLKEELPVKFSFEKDWLEKMGGALPPVIFGKEFDNYFIDIGISSDYELAQNELSAPPLDLQKIDSGWTLFLDRDGVINHEKHLDYIRNWDEFKFYDRVIESIKVLGGKFGRIIVVSNQRGVGRELMKEADLHQIHRQMKETIEKGGGRLDAIYYCTSTDNLHLDRKPNPGMAFRAKAEFPSVDFSKSIIIGNKLSDMRFGRNAGMYTVYLRTTNPEQSLPHPDIDMAFSSLAEFTEALP